MMCFLSSAITRDQYKLVVLVRLREKKAQEARCLGESGRGKGMLIVCDGFDELPVS